MVFRVVARVLLGSCYRVFPMFTKELLCGSKGVAIQFVKVS